MIWQRRRTDRKRRRFCVELLEDRRLLAGVISQVGHFDTWDGGVIRSTDVAGIAYHPSGHLYLADSEINELPLIFNGDNVFETSLSGDRVYRGIASGNTEPTGITFNEFDGHFYVTNDTGDKLVTRYNGNLDNPLYQFAPKDDVRGATDPEGITSDPSTGLLYVADGHDGDLQVLTYRLDLSNPNAATRDVIFQGVFSVADQMDDAEGIAFHEPTGHLFLMDSGQDAIFEYTTSGVFVEQYDISGFSPQPRTPQGLTFGPTSRTSDNPLALSLYIADGGRDNFPDGGVYEAVIGNFYPETSGIADVNILVGDTEPVIDLFAAFEDFEDSDDALTYTVTNNSNSSLVTSTTIDGARGTLMLTSATGVTGSAEITVRATDTGNPALFVVTTFEFTVDPVDPNRPVKIQSRVAASSDDAEEEPSGSISLESSDLELTLDRTDQQVVGMRFTDLNIPASATIKNAYLQFQADESNSESTQLTIYAEAIDNAPTFSSTNGNISSRITTTASVPWSPLPWTVTGEAGQNQRTPNLSAIVQEIVDRSGWSGGNSLAIIVSGNGWRVAESFDGDASAAPLLVVEYTTNHPPVLAAIGNKSVDEGSRLTFTASATDPDLPANNLSFSLDSGSPPGATINPTSGEFNWTPGEAQGPAVYSVTVRVTDDGKLNLDHFETINITVGEVNRAPVLAAIGDQSIEEGSRLTFTASATDPDLPANNLSFSLDAGAPAGATIDPTTGEFNWTPGEAEGPAVYSVTVRVTDDGTSNLDDFETFDITVSEVNQPPVLAALGNKSIDEGSPLTFTASATDADLPANNLSFSLDSGAPPGATIDPSTGQFRWTPPGGTSLGEHTVTVRVSDDRVPNLDDFETITITVNDVNLPPVLAAIGEQSVEEGSLLTFTVSASDPDLPANNLSFSLDAGAPAGATIDPTTGEFNWTPEEAAGSVVHSVTVRVTDDGTPSLADFETIDITVREVNKPPLLAAVGNKSVDEGSLLTFTASATDANLPANSIFFSLDSGAPAGASIDPTTGQFNWTPPGGTSLGNHTVTVRVTDDGVPSMEDFETITITVNDVNLPPVLTAIGAQRVGEGSPLAFTASATDLDQPADNLLFSLDSGAPAGATINPTTGEFNWTPGESEGSAVYSVTVRVTEDGAPMLDDFETINITVDEVNQAPVLAVVGNQSIDEGSLLTFTASATDPDLPANNFSFSLDSGAPAGATIDSTTGEFRWTPTEAEGPAVYSVTVRVTDDGVPSLNDFETFEITVGEVNEAPVLAAIGNMSVDEGSQLTFRASATDADLAANNLFYSLDAGAPQGATIDPNTGQFSWTPPGGTSPGNHTLTVRVTDDGAPTLDDFETITITVNDVELPPVLAAIGEQIVDEGSTLTFTASATDPDLPANNLSFSLDAGAPDGATIDPTSGEFNWTSGEADGPAIYTVTVRVTEDAAPNLDVFETINITVGEVNQAPVLASIGNQSIDEGSLLTFTASATDADLPANNLSFSLDSGAPPGATIDPSTGHFRWTPPAGTSPGNHTLTVRVSDDGFPNLEAFETITITVNDVDLPPVLSAIGAQSVEEGSSLTFIASATDPDLPADNLLFSLDSGAPAGATINPTTGEFTWSPGEAEGPAVYSVTVRVTDDGTTTLDDFETINITVDEVNQAPVLAAIDNKSIDEGSLLTFTASTTDSDLPVNKLTYTLDSDAPSGATIDPTTGEFRWTPTEAEGPAVYSVTVRVTDDGVSSLDDFETFEITVGEVNEAPVLAALGEMSVDEGSQLTFTASATDADLPANNLSFSLDPGAPLGATIDPSTGQFRWTAPEGTSPGDHTVTVRVSDDGQPSLDDFETITITVIDINLPPVLAAIGTRSVDEGSLLAFTASATDPDLPADRLSFTLDAGAPPGASIHPGTGRFNWMPPGGTSLGNHIVTVRVTDDDEASLDDFETFTITVNDVNLPPVLAAIGEQSVDEGSTLTFTASATDPDEPANNLFFSLGSDAPAGATIDSTTGEFTWTPSILTRPDVYSVTVRVTDDGMPNLADFETIDITVGEVNQAPVLSAIGSMSTDEGSPLTFIASAIDPDLPANNTSFSLDAGAPAGATIDPTTGEFNWVPDESAGPAVYSVTVRVTDDGTPNLDDFETFDIFVGEVNQSPVLAALGDMSVDEGSLLTFTASATDADSPANNLFFSLDAGAPPGATIDPITGQFRWTPPGGTSPGNHAVTVRVSDDGMPSLDDVKTITITVNDVDLPPVLTRIGEQSVEKGRLLTFTAVATDPDMPASNLSFSLDSGAPAGATIHPVTGEFNWMPGHVEGRISYSVTVRVTEDGTPGLEDFETFNITVYDVNERPVLAPIGDKRVDEGSLLTFTATATDLNLPTDRLVFSLDSGAPQGATIDPSTGHFSWSPPGGTSPGNHTVTVRVTDDGEPNLDDFETITITVTDVNLPPMLAAIGGQIAEEGSPLTFTASAADLDLPADNLSFSLDAGAPSGATINPITGRFSWTPGEAHGSALFSVTVRVMDDGTPKLEDFETINITVREVNQAPVLAAIGNKRVNEGRRLTFTALATDDDFPDNNLTFSLDSGAPPGASIDPSNGQFSWTPPEGTSGNHAVTVRVNDNGVPNREDFETITIVVEDVNLPPVLAEIGAHRVDEGSLLSFTASASDPDLTDNVFFSLGIGAPAGATIDPITGEFRWTPTEAQGPAVYFVNVWVSDDGTPSMKNFQAVNITVDEVNQTPVLAPIDNKHINEGNPITFTASATDADLPANNLTFSLANAPAGATINPSTGRFSWTPPLGTSTGTYTATIRVTDNGVPSRTASRFVVFSADLIPDINVMGNGRLVVDGDVTPDLSDHTDFGSLKVDGELLTRTYRIENLGTATLDLTGSPRVEINGANAADFTVTLQPPESIDFGQSGELTVEFNPGARGLRTATISIQNNDDDKNPYQFNIHGTGTQNPLDVNRDSKVTVLDALAIINQINRMLANQESASGSVDQALYDYDANSDGQVSALDALTVINHISGTIADGESTVDSVVPRREAATPTPKSSLDDDLIRLLADDNIIAGRSQH